MSDIVERLRGYSDRKVKHLTYMAAAQAADLIEAQAQRIKELEAALEVADDGRNHANELLTRQAEKVRALEESTEYA